MRSFLRYLSPRTSLFTFVRTHRLAKKFASRFVAGETIDEAVAAAKELQGKGITVSLDMLGESVAQPAEAEQARDTYLAMLEGDAGGRGGSECLGQVDPDGTRH